MCEQSIFICLFFEILKVKFFYRKQPLTTIVWIFIRVISTISVTITSPHFGYTLAVTASKFTRVTSNVTADAHTSFVYQSVVVVTLAFDSAVGSWVTRLIAATIFMLQGFTLHCCLPGEYM